MQGSSVAERRRGRGFDSRPARLNGPVVQSVEQDGGRWCQFQPLQPNKCTVAQR